MVDTPFSRTIQEHIDSIGDKRVRSFVYHLTPVVYLLKYNSVPAFLSSVNLELFSRQTMVASSLK